MYWFVLNNQTIKIKLMRNTSFAISNNILVSFAPFAIWSPHFETEVEIIQNHIDNGGKSIVLSCNGDLKICEPNPTHKLAICAICKSRFRSGMRWLKSDMVSYRPFYMLTKEQKLTVDALASRIWFDVNEVRSFKIDAADIGLSAMSSLITFLREPYPDIFVYHELVNKHIVNAATVYFSIKNQLISSSANSLSIFNGRFSSLRPALRAAQALKIYCLVHERASNIDKYSIFENTYPHNLKAIKKQMDETYLNSTLQDDEKCELGLSWFEERRKGLDQAWPSLTKHQTPKLLPDGFTLDTINIVIFISSDDEYMACEEWDNPYYMNQNKAIEELMKDIGCDGRIKIFLRVHPILKSINNSQTVGINELALKYKTLNIIPAESLVHSYSLIDAADVIITYGSTVGIEAAYAGKISILIGRALYEDLSVCIRPKSHQELISILREIAFKKNNFAPISCKQGLIKYGLFQKCWGLSFNYVVPTSLYSAKLVRNNRVRVIKASVLIRYLNMIYVVLHRLLCEKKSYSRKNYTEKRYTCKS